jgi:hypothetical protein
METNSSDLLSSVLRRLAPSGVLGIAAFLTACGGGGDASSMATSSSGSGTVATQMGTVPLLVSDDTDGDWATVGVRVLSIALIPQGGGSNVTVYSAPQTAPYVNLEQLDQLGEILGNVSVPVGTYTGAVVTVAANPGDVLLTVSNDPETGFASAGMAGQSIPVGSIQIQNTQGTSGSLTVPINVTFDSSLVVTTTSSNALDLEFDLSHPAFLVAHERAGDVTPVWAVNFRGPVRHHPIADITSLVLRHLYATLNAVAGDGLTLSVTKDHPTLPVATPETAIAGSTQLSIAVDATNGTLFYDLDGGSSSTIKSFSNVAGLAAGKFLRIAARYQQNGTLVATRIWSSSTFNSVWVSPEGHVLHVDTINNDIMVTSEKGTPVQVNINANTQFYYHGGTTAIGSGTAFLSNLVRGFKVHVAVADPLAATFTATGVDIENAAYSGTISGANTTGFTYTHAFPRSTDNYQAALDYIAAASANGKDSSGNAITGFKWWNFAYPTLVNSGSAAVSDFMAASSVAGLTAYGVTDAKWGDSANPGGWTAPYSILLPIPVPIAHVTAAYVSGSNAFAIATNVTTLNPASRSFTVDFGAGSGSATLVYQVDRNGSGIVTVSPIDITTPAGLATFTAALTSGTTVKVYGVPEASGHLKGYVIVYYTGTVSTT